MIFPQVDAFRGGKNLVRVVGHRGARGILPENSMIGFEFALSIGVNLLEFDVLLTKDEVPVITHNHRVNPATFRDADGAFVSSEPKIADLTFAELRQFEIGQLDGTSDYGKRFPEQAQLDGIRVPQLSELFELVTKEEYSNTHLMLELKSDPEFADDVEKRKRLVDKIVGEVRRANLQKRTLLHSFDWNILRECQLQAPDMPTSFLTQLPESPDEIGEDSSKSICPNFEGREAQIPDLVHEAGGSLWCPNVSDVTAKGVERANELGLCVVVWTVNEPDDIERMIKLGVDAIVSDYPGRVQRKLTDRSMRWS